jgi:hypothetical protein
VGVRATAGKSQKKTHPEKAKKLIKIIKIIKIKAMIEGQLEG